MQSTQGTPLDCLHLVVKEADVPELHGAVIISCTVLGRSPPPGHHTDSRLKYIPVFLWKRPVYLAWSITLRDRLHIFRTPRGQGGTPRECKQGNTIFVYPSALLQLNETPQKGAYTLIRSFDFCNCHPGDTSRSPGPEASRDYNCDPQDCIYLCTLTAATWGSGFQSAWNWVLNESLCLGTLAGLGTPSTGAYQE